MGVKGFLYMLKTKYKKTLVDSEETDMVLIDGNCILHDVAAEYSHLINPNVEEMITAIVDKFHSLFVSMHTNLICVCLDGVPPLPKQLCQKRRREDNFSISSYLLPGTLLMQRIERALIRNFQCDYINVYSSTIVGEGEQKMIQILKKHPDKSVNLLSYDSDVIILSLLQIKSRGLVKTLVTIPSFRMVVDVYLLYTILIRDKLFERLLWACVLCGNDFFPQFYMLKHMNTTGIFSFLKTHPMIKSFQDLNTENKCTCNFNKETAKTYVNLLNWYEEYFFTNKFISADPYTAVDSPCVNCILQIDNRKFIESFFDKKNHLSYVLSSNHHY